jgi:hypothetical protein
MLDPQRHKMQLKKTYPSGAQEWLCPSCGRWFVMHHLEEERKLKIVVLEDGDDQVQHVGSQGPVNLDVGGVEVKEDQDGTLSERGPLH